MLENSSLSGIRKRLAGGAYFRNLKVLETLCANLRGKSFIPGFLLECVFRSLALDVEDSFSESYNKSIEKKFFPIIFKILDALENEDGGPSLELKLKELIKTFRG